MYKHNVLIQIKYKFNIDLFKGTYSVDKSLNPLQKSPKSPDNFPVTVSQRFGVKTNLNNSEKCNNSIIIPVYL